ncbi:60S ribosomal protein L18a-like protein [Rhynchospora pubera]|uniref:60S ribosomal protein L18a-like protein n=1 Tax=Rhynchospora pubera TaxID=906938 RepID=A0AAV8DAI7_9POAL|nr:60S ribosomal protein L18a-like protein [Rhynchospora pubera]
MSAEGEKAKGEGHVVDLPQHQHPYGTFQGPPSYPPPPVMGFPQPAPPPGLTAQGYQAVPGYNVTVEGREMRERRLPCCGIGIGWLLFILGFFLAAIPWYVGAIMLCFSRVDYREKPGYIGCTIAAVLATIAIIIGATKGTDDW